MTLTLPGPASLRLVRRAASLAVLMACLPGQAMAQPVQLTAAERSWIAAHPVIRVTSDAQLAPLEYMRDGRLSGLSAEYLELISERTGLHFEFTQARDWDAAQDAIVARQTDMLVNAMPDRLFPATETSVQLSRPYLVAYSVVFSKPEYPSVWSMDDLAGKRVAARSQGQYADVLQLNYPSITVVPVLTPLDAFQMVMDGKVDAAMGTTMTFVPFITRRDHSELYISHPQITMAMTAQFATRKDWPQLHAIIEKAMSSVSTGEETEMRERWLRTEDFGAPTLKTVWQYNGPWVAAIAILILTLAIVARWAMRARRAAVEGERVKARFLATMSHEIRTPINVVLGAIEVLADEAAEGRQRELVETAEQAAEALTGLLDNVLDLSKLDEGKMQLEKVPVEIRALGRSIASIFSGELLKRGMDLHVDLPAEERWLMLDPTRLRQVLMNLLGNARKFTEHGSITLAIDILEESGTTWLHAVVSDTGCGIPTALQAGIFDPYTQADGSVSRRYGGTGLGLAISKELVVLMGGTIELYSEEGEGTTVSLRIPVEPAQAAPVAAASHAGASIARLRVLVVDDHAPNRLVLSEQLSRLGITAETADSAHSALARLHEDRALPDVVLLDCFMPDVDGYQTCRMIRASGIAGSDRLPVIAISAATDAAHLKRCQDSGMNGVLKKPIRLTELRGMLALWSGGAVDAGENAATEALQRQVEADLAVDLHQLLAGDVQHLLHALQAADQAQIVFYAHRLHGAAGLVGKHTLAATVAAIEHDPMGDRGASIERLSALLEELRQSPPPVV
ncbi:TPA: transporter substrate-binding domain-containing protein [Stenotrophomonas maltophilia]|nr:transporter substrate-binding domain-containing protein [Stenotrophomonas maltophilia]HDS1024104.1 transporter substrate-binding domain-containing protein [Stenotrophomonas maltophilia]HDS1028401.1 transporter substrate-binding domain-containing protein [Stenotrophomonas maltophilia]HDS1032867.1 transporter substrate-binding domain-containing protein [Stenotrophomonas maltophilia]